MVTKKTKKWYGFDFERNKSFENPPREGTDASDEAKQFLRDFRSDFVASLKAKGLVLHSFNKCHYYAYAVVTNEAKDKFVFVSIDDVRYPLMGYWNDRILVRRMKDEKDSIGGSNHFATMDELDEQIVRLMS